MFKGLVKSGLLWILSCSYVLYGDAGSKRELHIMVLGDTNVGKSSFLRTYMGKPWHSIIYPTMGLELQKKFLQVQGQTIDLFIWDTGGIRFFFNLSAQSMMQKMDGFILMYDHKYKESFRNLLSWHKQISRENVSHKPILVIENKCNFTKEEWREMLKTRDLEVNHHKVPVMSVNSKKNINVFLAVKTIVEHALREQPKKIKTRFGPRERMFRNRIRSLTM